MNNSSYLKDYVSQHPNNRMAWYLLGKEYGRKGQEGKAHYCYIQAGEVYEAFESSRVPAEVWKEYEAKLLEASRRKQQNRDRVRKALVALVLLLFLVLPAPLDAELPEFDLSVLNTSDGENPTPIQVNFTAKPLLTKWDRQKGIGEVLINDVQKKNSVTAVLAMDRAGDWLLWKPDMRVAYTVERDTSGKSVVQSLSSDECNCRPPDNSKLQKKALAWTGQQEQVALIASAIMHFREENHRLPKGILELRQPYPNNWIAGGGPDSDMAFKLALDSVEQQQLQEGDAPRSELNPTTTPQEPKPRFFMEKLEIKVDKKKHLLALVSGDIILRVYQVGLGGDRTPQGTFAINEKVINPNGHSNGEFGSRGMGLSNGNYAIHGTNEEDSIGKDESLGCVRMKKEDIEELFDLVPKGTKVTIGEGIVPNVQPGQGPKFKFPRRQDQTNPHKKYHWLG